MTSPFTTLTDGDVTDLNRPEDGARSAHRWSQQEIDALTLAQAADRPLLVRGEPGTGKTQLARAAAQHLEWELRTEVIHPRYEASDLIYRFDAVRRLADAQQPMSRGHGRRGLKHDADYWEPGPLWRAFDWDSASRFGTCRQARRPAGTVILIDEIDKADSDLPNSLLEVLGQRSFQIAPLRLQVGPVPDGYARPLILVTTNEERELPAAFLRRCIVLNLGPASGRMDADWLIARAEAHFDAPNALGSRRPQLERRVLELAARQLAADREAALGVGLQPPGPAEYLDLLYALHRLAPGDTARQVAGLQRLSAYAFVKNGVAAAGDDPDGDPQRNPLKQARKPIQAVTPPAEGPGQPPAAVARPSRSRRRSPDAAR